MFLIKYFAKNNKATMSYEFALFLVALAAAAIITGVYIKRGIQGRVRQSADQIGTAYSPRSTSGTTVKTLNRQVHVDVWSELGGVNGTQGKFIKRKEDIQQEVITDNVQETVR